MQIKRNDYSVVNIPPRFESAVFFYFNESLIGKRSPVLICLNDLKKVAFEMSYINICQVELHVHICWIDSTFVYIVLRCPLEVLVPFS